MRRWHMRGCPAYALAAFVTVSLATLALAWWLETSYQRRLQQTITELNQGVEHAVEARLNLYQFGLRGLRGALLATGGEEFPPQLLDRYSASRDIANEYPGARGFGFIRRVPQAQEADYVARMRHALGAPFALRQLAPHAGDRYVIEYIAPLAPNLAARGLDIASEVRRRVAAAEAARSGKPVLTGPITLVQTAQKPLQSFLFLLPVYGAGTAEAAPPARPASLLGWTYAPLLMEQVLGRSALVAEGVELVLEDVTDRAAPVEFFRTSAQPAGLPVVARAITERTIFGRTWRFSTTATPAWSGASGRWPPGLVLAVGELAALALAVLAYSFGQSRERARQLATTKAELAAIVESSADAIVARTLEGGVTSWNRSAEQLFGYPAAQAVGRPLAELILPPERLQDEDRIAMAMRDGIAMAHFDTRLRRQDGSQFAASVSSAPIYDARGTVVGVSKMIRDISRQKAAEAKIISLNENLEAQVAERTEALQQAQRTLRTIMDAVPSLIAYWDRGLTNLVANRAYHEWFGAAARQLPGGGLPGLLGAEWYEADRPHIQQVLAGHARSFEHAVRLPDGRQRHVLSHLVPDVMDGEVRGFFSIVHDVTEINAQRVQLAHALRENEVLLQTINAQLLFATLDSAGRLTSANSNFMGVMSCPVAALQGRPLQALLAEGTAPLGLADGSLRLQGGKAWRGDLCLVGSGGARYWCDTVLAPLGDAEGGAPGFVMVAVDITDRKDAEAEVARLNGLLNGVLAAATEVSIIATELDGTISVFNSGAERMLGYRAEQMVGRCSPAAIHLASEVAERGRSLSAEYGVPIEDFEVFVHVPKQFGRESRNWTYVTRDGRHITVALTVTAMHGEDGQVVGFLGMALDVTQQLQQQRELEASKEHLELAADVARLGIWSWTVADNSLRWNARMYELYDQPLALAEAGLGYEHWRARLHPDDVLATEQNLQQALAGAREFTPEFRLLLSDGSLRVIQAAACVERDAAGQPLRVTGMNLDITERKAFEETLLRAKLHAEHASAAKGMFLANMSHEIRTPLNATLGMLELLRRTELNERQQDYALKAESSAQSLLALLNDILDYSKIEAGKLELDVHSFDLEELLRSLGLVLAGNMGHKDVELIFDVDPRLPRELVGDRLRLQQVLINLAGNAIKFTASGQVIVRLALIGQQGQQVAMRVAIIDTGIGISAEQAQQIFEGFTQAEASTTRRFGGTGLGLAISKRLVQLMRGELQLNSTLGQGSHFWFDIQLLAQALPAPDAAHWLTRLGRQPRVLVVDDNAASRDILGATCQALGWDACLAHDGPAALEQIERAQSNGVAFDLILLDWRMPGMTGLEVAERIRQAPVGARPPVVIMVTAHGREALLDDAERRAVPFAAILGKPLTPRQIEDAFAAALDGKPVARPVKAVLAPHLAGLHILVVEDNALNRQVASELLAGAGARVQLAEGGLDGVRAATCTTSPPDVVLMDVQMPDIDGLEATRRIRSHAHGARLPIIAMTANASLGDRDACLAAGMNDHIGKPISIAQVTRTVLSVLGRDGASETAPLPDDSAEEILEAWDAILRRFNGALDIYNSALQAFMPQCELLLADVAMGAPGKVAKQLHNLRGMAATLGARGLSQLAQKLEQLAQKEPHGFQLTEPEREQLWQLARDSHERLRALCQLARTPAVPGAANEPQSTKHWREKLMALKALLDSSNTAAIESYMELRQFTAPEWRALVDGLAPLINDFRFSDAAQLVEQYVTVDGGLAEVAILHQGP